MLDKPEACGFLAGVGCCQPQLPFLPAALPHQWAMDELLWLRTDQECALPAGGGRAAIEAVPASSARSTEPAG